MIHIVMYCRVIHIPYILFGLRCSSQSVSASLRHLILSLNFAMHFLNDLKELRVAGIVNLAFL